SPTLHLRYNQNDPFGHHLPLIPDGDNDWVVTVSRDQVHDGFWYQITAGDAETDEDHIEAIAPPLPKGFRVTYQYRPFLNKKPRTSDKPDLKELRGTRVTLDVHTNRTLRDGRLEMDLGGDRKVLEGEVLPKDPKTLRFQFVLDRDGTYRVFFTSNTG